MLGAIFCLCMRARNAVARPTVHFERRRKVRKKYAGNL